MPAVRPAEQAGPSRRARGAPAPARAASPGRASPPPREQQEPLPRSPPFFLDELPPQHQEPSLREVFQRDAAAAASRVRNVPLTEAIVELVRAGHGISVLSRWSLGAHLTRGGLVTRRIGRRGSVRRWHAVYPRGTPLEAPIRTVVELLRSAMPLEP